MAFVLTGLAVGAGTALISGIGKSIAAGNMADKQKQYIKNLKEDQYISPALLDALGNSQKRKDATMYAGQDVDQANIDRNANQAFNNVTRGTTSSTNVVNAAMGIQGQKNIAEQQIQKNLAQYKDSANQDFTNLLLNKASVQNQNHQRFLGAKSALQGAEMQNESISDNAIWDSLSQVGGAAAGYGVSKYMGGGMKSAPPSSSNSYDYWAGQNGY